MPLPEALSKKAPKAKKQKRVTQVMHELKLAPAESPSRKASSRKQRQKQDVAIALKNAGMSKKRKKK